MALNVTSAVIGGGCQKAVASPSLVQWDRGQILQISGVDLPVAYNVEFCCQGDATTVTMIGNADGVEIPNTLLERGLPIIAYIVLHEGEDDRETEYWITIYVKQRAKPTNVTPDPGQQGVIDQLIAELDAGVEAAETAAAQAEAQVAHYPTVIDGTWHVWDQETESWEDTGEPAEGPQGPEGPEGPEGPQGETGPAGITPIVEVTEISGGHNVAFDYGTGDARNTDFDVMDGEVSRADLDAGLATKAPVIIDTASGPIASFSDGADGMPVKSLVCQINPQQDLHGQDAPYPPGGGTNKSYVEDFAETTVSGLTIKGENEAIIIKGTASGTISAANDVWKKIKIKIPADGHYYGKHFGDNIPSGFAIIWYDSQGNLINVPARGVDLTAGDYTWGLYIPSGAAFGTSGVTIRFTVQSGSMATVWSPYSNICPISGWTGMTVYQSGEDTENPSEIDVSWQDSAGTVYGGALNLTAGVLTVTDAEIASYNGETLPSTWISDRDVYAVGTAPTIGAQVVYKLATPVIYQLDPVTVNLLLGENNLWHDANGDIFVEYCADTKLYLEKLTQPTEDDMIANSNIASGKYFFVGNRLFLSTAAIANGATLTPGTNCVETNLAEALNALNS